MATTALSVQLAYHQIKNFSKLEPTLLDAFKIVEKDQNGLQLESKTESEVRANLYVSPSIYAGLVQHDEEKLAKTIESIHKEIKAFFKEHVEMQSASLIGSKLSNIDLSNHKEIISEATRLFLDPDHKSFEFHVKRMKGWLEGGVESHTAFGKKLLDLSLKTNKEGQFTELLTLLSDKLAELLKKENVNFKAINRKLVKAYVQSQDPSDLRAMYKDYFETLSSQGDRLYLENLSQDALEKALSDISPEDLKDFKAYLARYEEKKDWYSAKDLILFVNGFMGAKDLKGFIFSSLKSDSAYALRRINNEAVNALLASGETSAKIIKSNDGNESYNTAIMYLAPANNASPTLELCPGRSAGCTKACLYTAGRGGFTDVQIARMNKTRLYMEDKKAFFKLLIKDIKSHITKCNNAGLVPVIRLNGTSDISWENEVIPLPGYEGKTIFDVFGDESNPAMYSRFYDYTKVTKRIMHGPEALPKNYHLTFSRSETNDRFAVQALKKGFNVAVVFDGKVLPKVYEIRGETFEVLDGDSSDERFKEGYQGKIVGLLAKGFAKKDTSGFVLKLTEEDLKKGQEQPEGELVLNLEDELSDNQKEELKEYSKDK